MGIDAADGSTPDLVPLARALDLRNNTVESVLLAVAELAVERTGGDCASVTLVTGKAPTTFVATDDVAMRLDETQYGQGYGPCLDAVLASEPMLIRDARTEDRWPRFTPVAIEAGVLSSLSMPIPVLESVAASVNVYATQADALGDADRTILDDVIGHASAAIANIHVYAASRILVEQMHTAALSRAVIDQARGILMQMHRCTAEEAFDLLRRTSQRTNRKMRDVAQELVDQVSSGQQS
ncbi:MAG: hypothetical protein QOJ79_2664 [Actinomycetota bacterium]|jgi:GAF domain-containing protein|nr:hypothetical protein [Actinomycetota bacterium]